MRNCGRLWKKFSLAMKSCRAQMKSWKQQKRSCSQATRSCRHLNEELKNRNQALGRLNDDLANLQTNIDLPVVIVDSDLKIRRFTASAQSYLKNFAIRCGCYQSLR